MQLHLQRFQCTRFGQLTPNLTGRKVFLKHTPASRGQRAWKESNAAAAS
jgi:hypothetical protein